MNANLASVTPCIPLYVPSAICLLSAPRFALIAIDKALAIAILCLRDLVFFFAAAGSVDAFLLGFLPRLPKSISRM